MRKISALISSGLMGFATLMAIPAVGKESANNANIKIFSADYFDVFTPRSALDMVLQVPGFQIIEGGTRRGLGQGGANILVNGERISSKVGAQDFLSRINSKDVTKIELLDGAKLDIPGLSGQVVNIIVKTSEIGGNWNWSPSFRKELKAGILNGSFGLSGKNGELDWQLNFRNQSFRFGNWGVENRSLADGTLFETRDEKLVFHRDAPRLSLNVGYTPKENHKFNFLAEYSQPNNFLREVSKHKAFASRGDNDEQQFFRGQDVKTYKISADYEFPFEIVKGGKLKLIGLYDMRNLPAFAVFDTYRAGNLIGRTRFGEARDTVEAISRLEYGWEDKKGDWQWALEGAYNSLDGASTLEILDINSGNFIDIPVPGGTAKVEEKRAETNITHTRKITPKWTFGVSLGVEYSEISQSGDNNLVRDFVRPKGYINSTYQLDNKTQLRARIERQVGQLNFRDFLASISLVDNLANASNAELVPEQIWATQLEWDRQFSGGHNLRIKLYSDWITDLVDRIPVGVDGDAIGNIDNAVRYGVDFNATIKGDGWGYKGTRLDLVLDLADSKVKDPLTNQDRRLNRSKIWSWSVNFRHDIDKTDWAYGGRIRNHKQSNIYRLDTISLPTAPELYDRPNASVFIEHKNFYGLKINATLENILDARDVFRREIFTDRRDIGVLDIIEEYERGFGQTLKLSISSTF